MGHPFLVADVVVDRKVRYTFYLATKLVCGIRSQSLVLGG